MPLWQLPVQQSDAPVTGSTVQPVAPSSLQLVPLGRQETPLHKPEQQSPATAHVVPSGWHAGVGAGLLDALLQPAASAAASHKAMVKLDRRISLSPIPLAAARKANRALEGFHVLARGARCVTVREVRP